MPRLKAEVVEQRRNFVMDFFSKNMALTGQAAWDKAQEAIKAATGMSMSPDTILELYGKVHSDKVKVTPPKMELIIPKEKVAIPAGTVAQPQADGTVVAVPQDQANLIAALRKKIEELEESVKNRNNIIAGLTIANEILKKDAKGSGPRIIDVCDMSKEILDTVIDGMR